MTKKNIFLLCLAQFFLLISAEAVEKNLAPISVPDKYEVENGFVGMQRDVVRLLERKALEDSFNNPIQKLRAMNGVDAILSKQLQHVHKTDQIYVSCFERMMLEKSLTKWSEFPNDLFLLPSEIRRLVYWNGIYIALVRLYYKNGLCVSQDGGKHWRVIEIIDITYADNRFIALLYYGELRESIDGIHWNRLKTNSHPKTFVATAEPIVLRNYYLTLYQFSYDNGETWYISSLRKLTFDECASLYAPSLCELTFGKDTFVGYDENGDLFYGDKNNILAFDEENKSYKMLLSKANIIDKKINGSLQKLVYGNGIFICMVKYSYNEIYISNDGGQNWRTIILPKNFNDIAYCKCKSSNNGIFVATGFNHKKMYTSLDGMHWKPIPLDNLPYIDSICSANGLTITASSIDNMNRFCTDDEVKELIAKDNLTQSSNSAKGKSKP